MDDAKWYLRTQDETFGPETASQLLEWAKLGRVLPGQEVSDDNVIWRKAEDVAFLDMRFSIDIGDGSPRGPFNRAAAEALLASGRLPQAAKLVEVRAPFEDSGRREEESGEAESAPATSCADESEAPGGQDEPPASEPAARVVERVVEKVIVDETRVRELEGLLEEERRHTADLQRRVDEGLRSASGLKSELRDRDVRLAECAAELERERAASRDANARAVKLSEQVMALEDELKRLPAAASEVADIQAAVFKIMQDEAASISATIEREKAEFEESRKRHQARAEQLSECRREILKMSGRDVEEMTRKALVERPEDPRTACLRRDYEELRRLHEKSMLDSEAKIRQLADQVREARAEGMRAGESLRDVTQLRAETEQLRERLQRTEKDLLDERQRIEELRQREALGKHALMARLKALESPSIGTAASMETNQSREAKQVKLPGWMRLKRA